jgi:CheY-like chemotaxis protein
MNSLAQLDDTRRDRVRDLHGEGSMKGGAPMTDGIAVLVVEDEPLVRMDTVDQFEDEGFQVFEASNANDAIALLANNPSVRVLFTDIDMPGGMNGLMLAGAVRKRWPLIKIIVTSGHWEMREQDLPVEGRFLLKPYDARHVAAVARELFAGARNSIASTISVNSDR